MMLDICHDNKSDPFLLLLDICRVKALWPHPGAFFSIQLSNANIFHRQVSVLQTSIPLPASVAAARRAPPDKRPLPATPVHAGECPALNTLTATDVHISAREPLHIKVPYNNVYNAAVFEEVRVCCLVIVFKRILRIVRWFNWFFYIFFILII